MALTKLFTFLSQIKLLFFADRFHSVDRQSLDLGSVGDRETSKDPIQSQIEAGGASDVEKRSSLERR